ncbi:unnamed protein product [Toxocara canis]|uniref:AAA-ATPase_like domain-containing protein n=1 Tax=Toxocara canis TaxID=6265 RepID=A0A183VG79_TOXCA|nr:unnamed protein product [Toxocara canis]
MHWNGDDDITAAQTPMSYSLYARSAQPSDYSLASYAGETVAVLSKGSSLFSDICSLFKGYSSVIIDETMDICMTMSAFYKRKLLLLIVAMTLYFRILKL